MNYIIRNDVTGVSWVASASEALLYAVGGVLDTCHSVFHRFGGGNSLIVQEVE